MSMAPALRHPWAGASCPYLPVSVSHVVRKVRSRAWTSTQDSGRDETCSKYKVVTGILQTTSFATVERAGAPANYFSGMIRPTADAMSAK